MTSDLGSTYCDHNFKRVIGVAAIYRIGWTSDVATSDLGIFEGDIGTPAEWLSDGQGSHKADVYTTTLILVNGAFWESSDGGIYRYNLMQDIAEYPSISSVQ